MAHKIGRNDTLYEPDISGEVDFSFYEDDNDVDRTKGCEMVSGPTLSSVIGSSSPGASCLEDSRYRCVEDTSSGGTQASRRRQGEGQKGGEEVLRQDFCGAGVSSDPHADMVGGSAGSFEAQQQQLQQQGASAVMEHADPNLYSSDEWEESDLSDTDGDHSDSSDDDDPKSQVDRLIDQVTLVYLDGENSNLSSETESSDDSDYDDSDSESDITDVSPLISAAASPLGLSPVLPRRALGTSPLALHDNRELGFGYQNEGTSVDQPYNLSLAPASPPDQSHHPSFGSQDPSDMTLLLKAVVELDQEQRRNKGGKRPRRHNSSSSGTSPGTQHANGDMDGATDSHHPHQSPPIAIHPIDASPHHRHLRRGAGHHHRRKNMSFTNEEVRRIDRENRILLEKIMNAHSRSSKPNASTTTHHHHHHHHNHHNQSYSSHNSRPVHRPSNSTVNRRREEEKIRRENMILLRKIQEAKPSRDVAAFRSPRHRASHSLRPASSLPATPGSCGALARTVPGHVAATAPRKETAL